jgi:hypothetical protein
MNKFVEPVAGFPSMSRPTIKFQDFSRTLMLLFQDQNGFALIGYSLKIKAKNKQMIL